MSTTCVSLPMIERAIQEVCQAYEPGNCRSYQWKNMSEDELWRELSACILGSRVPFHVAYAAVERMERANLFTQTRRSLDYDKYERDLICALSGSEETASNLRPQSRYPFPKLRAKQIRASIERFCASSRTIRMLLDEAGDVREARRSLASEVSGIGPKQASLFLRNIGYTDHVAVLDIHVLTYMNWIGLVPDSVKSVKTVRQYEALEDAFIGHASSFGYPPDRFDVAVWVVVRVVKRECRMWH